MATQPPDGVRTRYGRAPGNNPSSGRHPLLAVAMVLPLAILLAVAFGGWNDLVVQASRAAELMGR